MAGNTLSDQAMRDLREMKAWWLRQPRNQVGGGGPKFPPIPHGMRRFELKTAWATMAGAPAGSTIRTADAYMVKWSASTKKYVRLPGRQVFEVTDRDGTFGGTTATNASTSSEVTGTVGLCWKPHDCPMWEVIASSSLTPRILYDDVAPGDTNKLAWPVKSDNTADTSADKVTIQNTWIPFRAYGDAHTGFDATTAAKVLTFIGPDGKETIACGQGLAKRCSATAKGIISGSTGTVDAVVPVDDGQSPVASSSTELTVNNPRTHYFADNQALWIVQNGSSYDLEPMAQMLFKGTLSGSLSQGGSASASLEVVGTVTVYDCLMKSGATAIASGKKIVAEWDPNDSKFYAIAAECA